MSRSWLALTLVLPWSGVAHAADGAFALADALRTYRAGHLSLRQEALTVTPSDPWGTPEVIDEWHALYRGPERIDVPEFLATVGAWRAHFDVEHRARRAQRTASALYVLGGAGAVATLTGFVGVARVTGDPTQSRLDHSLVTGGIVAMLGGFVGGTLPQTRAWRLRHRPEASLSDAQLQALGGAYNTALRHRLGLYETDVRAMQAVPGALALDAPADVGAEPIRTGHRPFVIRPTDAIQAVQGPDLLPDG